MTAFTRSKRAKLLAGVGTTVLSSMIASGAFAAETTIDTTNLPGTVGHKTITSVESNIDEIRAELPGATAGITLTGTQTGTSNSVTTNIINANATGNSFTNFIDLSQIDSAPVDGVASLGIASNTDNGTISSSVTDSALQISLTDFVSGSAANTGNTISAVTKVNDGSTLIQGEIPNSYASATTGVSEINRPATLPDDQFSAQASIVASSVQQNLIAGHTALAGGNGVTLDLLSTIDNTIASGPVLDDNTIASSLSGNSAVTVVDIQPGGAPQFQGSAVVSNLQQNTSDDTTVANSASTIDSTIAATVAGVGVGNVNTLSGGLSVQGNTISSAVTGNRAVGAQNTAGNMILLGDAVSFQGAGSTPAGSSIAYDAGDLSQSVVADLILNNSQGNVGLTGDEQSWSAITAGAEISATVQSLENGSIDLSGNAIRVSATGNTASGALASGANAASFDGTAASASQQVNHSADIAATAAGTAIVAITSGASLDGGITHGSSIDVGSNIASARAFGNDQSQSIDLAATDLTTGSGNVVLSGGTAPDGNVSAAGATTIANLQSNYNSTVSASNSGSTIGLDADSRGGGAGDTILSSLLSTTLNSQEAVAVGSNSNNTLGLTGTTVGTSAGIASVQIGHGGSDVSAALSGAQVGLIASTHVEDSSLAVTGNVQRAIGYGTMASNALGVTANQVTIDAASNAASLIAFDGTDPLAFSNGAVLPSVNAGYGILSDQSIEDDVTASAVAAGNGIGLSVEGDLLGSSASNDSNALVGAAYGNDVNNDMVLAVGTLTTTGGIAPVGNITNTQAVGGSDIAAVATGTNVVATDIEDAVVGSSVSTSANTVQVLAFGNRAEGNDLKVTGTTVDTAVASPDIAGAVTAQAIGADLVLLQADASFSVQNAQSGSGSVLASQLDDATTPTAAATIRTSIGDDILGSSVISDGNRSLADATSNRASNSLAIEANSVATTSGLQNFQTTNADVSALIGMEATPPGTITVPFGFTATADFDAAYDGEDDVYNINTADSWYVLPTASLTANQIAYLIDNGWSVDGSNLRIAYSGSPVLGPSAYATAQSTSVSGSTDEPTLGTPGQGGVFVAAGADILDSTISVSGNTVAGSVTGNSASNTLSVGTNEIATASGLEAASAGLIATDVVGAQGDHSLSNLQQVTGDGNELNSQVYATFAIDAAPDAVIDGSTLAVSGNQQRSTAVANTAANTLALSGNDVAVSSALSSNQWSAASVSADSQLGIFAAAAITDSSLDMSANANTALGVINDATNTLSVTATNIGTVDGSLGVGEVGNATTGTVVVTGDHVLSNAQTATTAVSGTASTALYNEDSIATATTGLVNSTVTIEGNKTSAEASANRAVNTLSLTASATQGANGGILNAQASSATATASATASLSLALTGDAAALPAATPALSGSSVTVEGNSTTALARGNYASNVLNSTAGSSYGTSTLPAGSATGATANVTSLQVNSGDVTAQSANTTYAVALNASSAALPAVSNGSVSVSGNQVASQAYGNSATNSVRLATLSTGTSTAAVSNSQVNSGAITASVSFASLGVSGTGSVGGSSLGVGGNTISASAVGNSVSNSIRGVK